MSQPPTGYEHDPWREYPGRRPDPTRGQHANPQGEPDPRQDPALAQRSEWPGRPLRPGGPHDAGAWQDTGTGQDRGTWQDRGTGQDRETAQDAGAWSDFGRPGPPPGDPRHQVPYERPFEAHRPGEPRRPDEPPRRSTDPYEHLDPYEQPRPHERSGPYEQPSTHRPPASHGPPSAYEPSPGYEPSSTYEPPAPYDPSSGYESGGYRSSAYEPPSAPRRPAGYEPTSQSAAGDDPRPGYRSPARQAPYEWPPREHTDERQAGHQRSSPFEQASPYDPSPYDPAARYGSGRDVPGQDESSQHKSTQDEPTQDEPSRAPASPGSASYRPSADDDPAPQDHGLGSPRDDTSATSWYGPPGPAEPGQRIVGDLPGGYEAGGPGWSGPHERPQDHEQSPSRAQLGGHGQGAYEEGSPAREEPDEERQQVFETYEGYDPEDAVIGARPEPPITPSRFDSPGDFGRADDVDRPGDFGRADDVDWSGDAERTSFDPPGGAGRPAAFEQAGFERSGGFDRPGGFGQPGGFEQSGGFEQPAPFDRPSAFENQPQPETGREEPSGQESQPPFPGEIRQPFAPDTRPAPGFSPYQQEYHQATIDVDESDKGADVAAGVFLVLAGLLGGLQPFLFGWIGDRTGWSIFQLFGFGFDDERLLGSSSLLGLILGGVSLLLGIVCFVPLKGHRVVGLVALLAALACAGLAVYAMYRADFDFEAWGTGFYLFSASGVVGVIGAVKALVTVR